MIKKIATWVGGIVAVLSLLTTAGGVFVLERENDDLYRDMGRIERDLRNIERSLHQKEMACEVLNERLKVTFSNGKYSHNYCPED